MTKLTIYPAIDLRDGQVVRLAQGDLQRQTVFGDDPAGVARRWLQAGAEWLHIVNLSGAFTGSDARGWDASEIGKNQSALQAILQETGGQVKVQFGGGLRSLDDVEQVLSMGVSRAILGTVAVESPELVSQAVNRFGAERVGVSIDARDNKVRVRGWTAGSELDPITLGKTLAGQGIRTVVYTDISRDGVGTGVNIQATRLLAEETGLSVIASGGVASLDDVIQAKRANLGGIIIGRALYDGRISLEEALLC